MFRGFLQFKSTSIWNTTNKSNANQESPFEVSFKITLANIHKNRLDYETQLTNRAPVAQFVNTLLQAENRVRVNAALRQRNTRYKNPQLVAQHCFVASFGRCFSFFTWRNQLEPQQKRLLRVEEMQRADWLIASGTSKFVARQVVSLMKNEQQNQNLLLKVDPSSTFRNNFLQPATNVFVAGQVDHAR